MSFCSMILVVYFVSFPPDLQVSGRDYNCQDEPVFTPSELVVKYGDPVNATCSLCTNCTSIFFDLEISVGLKKNTSGSEFLWTVHNMTEWDASPLCSYINIKNTQCFKELIVTVYQPPHDVSISVVNHTGPIKQHGLYTLQCDVLNVAPVENLSVTFYKGQEVLGHLKSTKDMKTPESDSFTHSLNISKDDNGAQFWCEAKLELGPEGPQPPLVVKSGKLTAIVYYAPELEGSPNVKYISIKRGETLRLNCSADGNPPPSYTWTTPFNDLPHNQRVFTVESVHFWNPVEFICNTSNSMGFAVVRYNVTVSFLGIILIILGVCVGFILVVGGGIIAFKLYKRHRMGHYSLKDVLNFRKQHTQLPVK